jgi:hypothetical protein
MPDYKTDAGLLIHLQKQAATIEQYKDEAGATAAEVTALLEDYANMSAILDLCSLVDEYKTTAFGIKRVFLRGEIGAPIGDFMAAPSAAMPTPLAAGVEKRSRERDGRWKRSATINEAALIALDLVDTDTPETPGDVKPEIELFAAQSNYEFAVVISNRGESDMSDVQIRRMNQESWTTVKSGTGKSISVIVQPTTPGQAEKIEVRVQLKRKNINYGQTSDPAYVTVSP